MERTLLGGDLGDGKVGAALGLGQLNALGYLLPHGWMLAWSCRTTAALSLSLSLSLALFSLLARSCEAAEGQRRGQGWKRRCQV